MKILKLVISAVILFSSTAYASEEYVYPSGETVGIKMYTDGLLVVRTSDVTDKNGNKIPAAKEAGIKPGDILISANGKKLNGAEELSAAAENETVSLEVLRRNENLNITVTPVPCEDGKKLGLWVRDSTAGIGTLSYISDDGKTFAALGHGITDVDTGSILSLKSGNILECSQISVTKSQKGDIGELHCSFDGENIGNILENVRNGIYGSIAAELPNRRMRIADIDEISEGDAKILCNVDGGGVREYDIEIKKVSKMNTADKTLVIEVTDPELIEKTGGIVQGMSGSPIIQGDLFVGAVTHVFINEPLRGFGVAGVSMVNHK